MSIYNAFIRRFTAFFATAVILLTGIPFSHSTVTVCAGETTDFQALADEIVVLVNEARAELGLKSVYAVPMLNELSAIRAEETLELMSHYRPDGTMFNSILDENEVFYMAAGENIASGGNTAEMTFEQWKNSPSHWATITNESYTHIGVSVVYAEGTPYVWYWEQLFIASDQELEGQYLPERYATVPVSYGDIDGDGYVTSLDYILLIRLLKKEVVLNDLQVESADCMYDMALTIADAVVLKKYLLGAYDSLPIYP